MVETGLFVSSLDMDILMFTACSWQTKRQQIFQSILKLAVRCARSSHVKRSTCTLLLMIGPE
ncbi:uncharacterized protein PHALS_14943 [Plasmopara halstedii]|uniref:Uncharacterized protein n=1 Tax=Plasmopara halstedii TaxID=4781 RepID=A0A0P1AXW7_PLAHL|nr:uncharacterized protein PHALS_14943 [Plasmopara halstedii]CEG46905.1 hypothetical protein PHALS_14943 [Plasmopara halstedii]|eukprot:XP_024583274.1 hypothetical protein PHALS_14943 [Plasmopara halstedii]